MNVKNPRILVVGQCDMDHASISRMLSEEFGAIVERAATGEAASRATHDQDFDLVLVNRVLDADGASGLDLIERLQSNQVDRAVTTMLVSNYAEAQDAAVARGAARGFGKDSLFSAKTRDVLTSALCRKDERTIHGSRNL